MFSLRIASRQCEWSQRKQPSAPTQQNVLDGRVSRALIAIGGQGRTEVFSAARHVFGVCVGNAFDASQLSAVASLKNLEAGSAFSSLLLIANSQDQDSSFDGISPLLSFSSGRLPCDVYLSMTAVRLA